MMASPAARRAFDLRSEPESVRRQYGYTSLGQCALLARRLVEGGCRFVGIDHSGWDHHFTIFPSLEKDMLPHVDKAFSALINDLRATRPARQHAGGDDGRNGPHAADQRPGGPGSLVDGPEHHLRRRRRQAGPGHRRHRPPGRCSCVRSRSASPTCCAPFSSRWASIPPGPITRRSAGRCRSSTAGASYPGWFDHKVRCVFQMYLLALRAPSALSQLNCRVDRGRVLGTPRTRHSRCAPCSRSTENTATAKCQPDFLAVTKH